MFAKATSSFVKEIDQDGCLIPLSRLNDSDKLLPLSVVIKCKPFWFWQHPKYLPSDFTLSDVLLGDKMLNPVIVETDFLKYEGTYEDLKVGKMGAGVKPVKVSLEGEVTSKLQFSFGTMKKQEVDVQKLLQDSRERVVNLEHLLIQQTRLKRREVLGVVKECILTTEPCSISEQVQEQGDCRAALGFRRPRKIQISVNNGNLNLDSQVSLEIPPETVIAYSIIELEVKGGGEYELCLLPDIHGGFEVDRRGKAHCVVDQSDGSSSEQKVGTIAKTSLAIVLKDLQGLKTHFELLAGLPSHTRSALFHLLQELILDREAITKLGEVLDPCNHGEETTLGYLESPTQTAQALLNLLHTSRPPAARPPATPLLLATHMLVSAMDRMSDDSLVLLKHCTSPSILQPLQLLVHSLESCGECCLADRGLAKLLESDIFERVEALFSHSSVVLHREGEMLRAEAKPGVPPLVMCVVLRGLAFLCME